MNKRIWKYQHSLWRGDVKYSTGMTKEIAKTCLKAYAGKTTVLNRKISQRMPGSVLQEKERRGKL